MAVVGLVETLATTQIPLAYYSGLIGALLQGQEGAPATVLLNGVAVTYPVTLASPDILRIERGPGETVTRLYGTPVAAAGITIQEADGSPTGTLKTLKMPNGTLVDNGSGVFTYTPPVAFNATNKPRLKASSSTISPSPVPASTFDMSAVAFWSFTPTATVTLTGIRSTREMAGANLRAEVFRVSTQAVIGSSPYATMTGGAMTATLSAPVTLTAGTQYMIGLRTNNSGWVQSSASAVSFAGFSPLTGTAYYAATGNVDNAYPSNTIDAGGYPAFELQLAGTSKDVIGPLDPADFPTVSAASALPINSGGLVVDDAARTATLTWKFSDGSTKSVALI
ncbi:hypothetical protein ACI3L1_06765 [Deinococcus sp. SM5_A1]|uniref:hypothetical protein n=1 Tax=Deinococcus sp. SM5_A1 TaxID=3379094 RepID=UPI00385949FF